MKFTNYLKSIEHVAIYPLISLVLFMAVFTVVIWYVYKSDKTTLQQKADSALN